MPCFEGMCRRQRRRWRAKKKPRRFGRGCVFVPVAIRPISVFLHCGRGQCKRLFWRWRKAHPVGRVEFLTSGIIPSHSRRPNNGLARVPLPARGVVNEHRPRYRCRFDCPPAHRIAVLAERDLACLLPSRIVTRGKDVSSVHSRITVAIMSAMNKQIVFARSAEFLPPPPTSLAGWSNKTTFCHVSR